MEALVQIAINTLIPGALFGLVAASFTLVHRVAKVLHLAHGGIIIAAGYAYYWGLVHGISVPVAVILATAVAVVLGVGCACLIYEPLRRHRTLSAIGNLIAAIALLSLIEGALLILFGGRTRSAGPLFVPRMVLVGGAVVTTTQLTIVVVSLVCVVLLAVLLKISRLGQAMRAVADHEDVAAIVGISPRRVRIATYAIASALGGISGALFAGEYVFEPRLSVLIAIKSFARSVIGGVGSVPGALVGSFIIEGTENVWSWFLPVSFREVVSLLLVIFVLLFRPWGLFGKRPA